MLQQMKNKSKKMVTLKMKATTGTETVKEKESANANEREKEKGSGRETEKEVTSEVGAEARTERGVEAAITTTIGRVTDDPLHLAPLRRGTGITAERTITRSKTCPKVDTLGTIRGKNREITRMRCRARSIALT